MPKKRKSKKQRSVQRYTSVITRYDRLYSLKKRRIPRVDLNPFQDLRRYAFRFAKYYHLVNGNVAPVNVNLKNPKQQTKAKIHFVSPKKTLVCIRRKERRESLFARKQIGNGKRVSEKRRYTEKSNITCR